MHTRGEMQTSVQLGGGEPDGGCAVSREIGSPHDVETSLVLSSSSPPSLRDECESFPDSQLSTTALVSLPHTHASSMRSSRCLEVNPTRGWTLPSVSPLSAPSSSPSSPCSIASSSLCSSALSSPASSAPSSSLSACFVSCRSSQSPSFSPSFCLSFPPAVSLSFGQLLSLLVLALILLFPEMRGGPLCSEAVLHHFARQAAPEVSRSARPILSPDLPSASPSSSHTSPLTAPPPRFFSSSFSSILAPSPRYSRHSSLSSSASAPFWVTSEAVRGIKVACARPAPLAFAFAPSVRVSSRPYSPFLGHASRSPFSFSSSPPSSSSSSRFGVSYSASSACSLSPRPLRNTSPSSSLRLSSSSHSSSPPSPSPPSASSPASGKEESEGISLLLSKPRGFCAGVSRAVGIVEEALRIWGPPVYVKHSIVHNEVVCEAMRKKGAVFVEEISDIPRGAVAVFSAHGVSPAVRAEAEARQLQVVDATCPLVTKVHVYVKQKAEQGYHIILIGHKNHVEVIGTQGEAPGAVTVVESVEDVEQLSFSDSQKLFYATQTTLSLDDCGAIRQALIEKYPKIETIPSGSICYATTNRQTALQRLAPETDLTIVVGSEASSNAKRLVETAQRRGTTAYLVNDPNAIDPRWLENVKRISLTSSASTPEETTGAVVRRLEELGVAVVSEHEGILERVPKWKFPKNLLEAGKKKLDDTSRQTALGVETLVARDS
ncbi:4-hydroxy-3-methylbut-2-enyl diphosphate reductase [Toxoplasma gondii TgCatPRC2]|uniref:4-hydroxy-3-methylbut-2-enyl diphosphate reductase n=1 Tax=Toxoplasma gondii TgCatPRC2 TaxID=1130821 RepID=A0A151H6N0_TOXGO|nr:4-hydroxy-3-methylbut-2-enyl diphosphate reductase [Toxoplasma gondii TgCatPRC2]